MLDEKALNVVLFKISRGCGTNIGAARKASAERRFQSERMPAESENATTTLDVYFHVVYVNETIEGGYVP